MLMRTALNEGSDAVRVYGPSAPFRTCWFDIMQGLQEWRSWFMLALMEVKRRYRRSTLGQFWLTLSMAATIAGIGLTFSVIFNQSTSSYIPFLGIGLIVWTLVSGLINDLAISFISAETYLQGYPGPRSFVIFSTIARNVITAAHNLLLVPLLLLIFQIPLTWATLLVIPGFFLILLNSVWIGMLIGPLCTRFRDLPSVITSVMQLIFFLTPIMFRPAQVQERLWVLTHLNPFSSFLEITRTPLLGGVPDAHHYILALIFTIGGYAVAIPFYARFRGRIVYWL
jgi:lipopolysaccharide transport system permease protein